MDIDLVKGGETDSKLLQSENTDYYFHVESKLNEMKNESCIDTKVDAMQCYTELDKSIMILMNKFFGMGADMMKMILLK